MTRIFSQGNIFPNYPLLPALFDVPNFNIRFKLLQIDVNARLWTQ